MPLFPQTILLREIVPSPGVRHEMIMLALAFIQMIPQALQPPNEKIHAGAVGMQVNDADRVACDIQDMIGMRHIFN